MIIVAQRFFTQQHAEVLVLIPADQDAAKFDLGVLIYDPTRQKIEEADPAQARHLGTLDLLSAFRAAVAEMARWTTPGGERVERIEVSTVPVSNLIARLDAFLGQLAAYAAMDSRWKGPAALPV